MPKGNFNNQTANTFEENTEMLKSIIFLPPPPADLNDISGSFDPNSPQCPVSVSKLAVLKALQRLKADKAPSSDGIYRIFKACA